MEETQLNTPLISQKCENFEAAQWQWQCGSNPFKEADPVKWAWQNYSDDENLIIEEAYSQNQEIAFLTVYEVDLKKMVQVNIPDRDNVRRVRRQEPSRFMMKLPEAKIVKKDQKTMNEAFGTVQHFLEYIMKRTSRAYGLYQKLEKLSLDCKRDEFEDLVHQVVVCIEKGAETRAKIIKTRTGSCRERKYMREAREIQGMIENNSLTLQDFLKAILKAYTMETFICYWLNELLRSEDWEEINVLTPYLVCLVYKFKLSDGALQSQNSQTVINDCLGFVVKHRVYLYRGAALTKDQLMSYNPNKKKYFSWNAVTSTSRDRNVARKFTDLSLNATANIGVIFLIEIDFDSIEDYHGMIDVSKDSRYPHEQEVILAPGTVFRLLEISLIESDTYEIHLKVTKNVQEIQEDVALLGVLQDQAILKDRAIIDGFPSQKGFKILELLKGNKLIRKLEIKDSEIEQHIMEDIENMRRTTNVRKEDIKLVNNTIVLSSLNVLAHYYSSHNLSDILMLNTVRFRCGIEETNPPIPQQLQIGNLILKDQTINMFRRNDQLKELWKRLKNESQIFRISLSIQKLQIQENELRDFFECIKEWKSLEDLTLVLKKSQARSFKYFNLLYQDISSLITLKKLSLKLSFSDEGLLLLQDALEPLKCLQSLSLEYNNDNNGERLISDQGLKNLKSALINLPSLRHLSLHFDGCAVSDQGLHYLKSALISFKLLEYLSLDLGKSDISDGGLNHLKAALISLPSLQHLSLIFGSRDARFYQKITDEGLGHLSTALRSRVEPLSLRHLSLKFRWYVEISDDGLNQLKNAFISLTSLQHLSLDFGNCKKISDPGLNHLKSAFISLTSLRHLSLNFSYCELLSNEGLNYIKDALISLTCLQHLLLDFEGCKNISENGLDHLKNALILLTSIQHLSLHLAGCNISDKGLDFLKSAFKSLASLEYLSLDLRKCNISDEGFNHLKDALIPLTCLQHLSLIFGSREFKSYNQISNKGLNNLKKALISLAHLQYFSLAFHGYYDLIKDAYLKHFKSALISLPSLQKSSVVFDWWAQPQSNSKKS